VADKLDKFLEEFHILDQNQYGYQKKKGTLELLEMLMKFSIKTQITVFIPHIVACFVDFKEAFDTLNHNKLLSILEENGVRGELHMDEKLPQ